MINVSDAFLARMQAGYRTYEYKVDITLADGTVLDTITAADIWAGGLDYEDAVTPQGSLQIGAAIVNALTLSLNNLDEKYSEMDFTDADVVLQVGLDLGSGNVEWHQRGRYTVDDASGQNTYAAGLSCLDYMAKFDRPYSESTLTYPATLLQILQDACTVCGVTLATTDFEAKDYVVQKRPNDSNMTFRDAVSYTAAIACKWARMNPQGQLELGWYNLRNPYAILGASGESAMVTNSEAFLLINGSVPFPVSLGSVAQQDISTSDIRVTGIYVKAFENEEAEEEDEELQEGSAEAFPGGDVPGEGTPDAYRAGQEGYIISITENPFVQAGQAQTVAEMIWAATKGLSYRPLSVSVMADPVLQAGDMVYVTDYKGRGYVTYASVLNFSAGSYLQVQATAETVSKSRSVQYSAASKAVARVEAMVEEEKAERKRVVTDLTQRVTSAPGMYMTTVVQADHSTVYYLHNKPAKADSDIIWALTANAIAVSTDGGETYPYGFTVDGTVVVQALEAEGVSADWITSGALRVEDSEGNIVLNVDCDSGELYITGAQYDTHITMDPATVLVPGILENSRKTVRFLVPLDRPVADGVEIGFDSSTVISVRQNGSYIISSASIENYTVTITRTWAGLMVSVTAASSLGGTDNGMVMVDLTGAFTFTEHEEE